MARMRVVLTAGATAAGALVLVIAALTFEFAIGSAVQVLNKAIQARGAAYVTGISHDISYPVANDENNDLTDAIRLFMKEDKDALGVAVYKKGVEPIVAEGTVIPQDIARRLKGESVFEAAGEKLYFSSAVTSGQETIGFVIVVEENTEAQTLLTRARVTGYTVFFMVLILAGGGTYLFSRRLSAPLERMTVIANGVAAGDLTQRELSERGFREVVELSAAINKISETLRNQTRGMKQAADGIMESSSMLAASTSQLASTASEQAASIAESTSTAEEIKQTGVTAAKNAHEIVEAAEKSVEVSREGLSAVDSSAVEIRRLREQVEAMVTGVDAARAKVGQVMEIIGTVKEIAEQSNLLAVNASIEAAKAGEFGRGFSVVALEVKSLADQSKRATAQVRDTLGSMQAAIEEAVVSARAGSERAESSVRTMEHTGTIIRSLTEIIAKTAGSARHIAISSNEQSVGFEQIAQAMSSIHQAANENMESMHHVEASCEQLTQMAAQLNRTVGHYRFN